MPVLCTHAVTPSTPLINAAPAANSDSAVFLERCRQLRRELFDSTVAKYVLRKVVNDKHAKFAGSEVRPGDLWARMVTELHLAFVNEHTVNAELRESSRKTRWDESEVKDLFLDALDKSYYLPVLNEFIGYDKRAAVDLLTLQQRVMAVFAAKGKSPPSQSISANYAGDTLVDQVAGVLDAIDELRKELKQMKSGHGFTPRGEKRAWTLDEMMQVAHDCFTDGVTCEHIEKIYDFASWMSGHAIDCHEISKQQAVKSFKDANDEDIPETSLENTESDVEEPPAPAWVAHFDGEVLRYLLPDALLS
eukprot:gene5478-6640_t